MGPFLKIEQLEISSVYQRYINARLKDQPYYTEIATWAPLDPKLYRSSVKPHSFFESRGPLGDFCFVSLTCWLEGGMHIRDMAMEPAKLPVDLVSCHFPGICCAIRIKSVFNVNVPYSCDEIDFTWFVRIAKCRMPMLFDHFNIKSIKPLLRPPALLDLWQPPRQSDLDPGSMKNFGISGRQCRYFGSSKVHGGHLKLKVCSTGTWKRMGHAKSISPTVELLQLVGAEKKM